jgi:hypothetical protein
MSSSTELLKGKKVIVIGGSSGEYALAHFLLKL